MNRKVATNLAWIPQIVFLIFACFLFFGVKNQKALSFTQSDRSVYMPIVVVPECVSHDVDLSLDAPSEVTAGQIFTATVILENNGCSEVTSPRYSIGSTNNMPIQPHSPPAQPITIDSGQRHTFVFTFFTQGNSAESVDIRASAIFFVEYSTEQVVQENTLSPFVTVIIKD